MYSMRDLINLVAEAVQPADTRLDERVIFTAQVPSDGDRKVRRLTVFENPSHRELSRLLDQTIEGEVRGFVMPDRSVIFWDAYLADHNTVIREIGVPQTAIRIWITKADFRRGHCNYNADDFKVFQGGFGKANSRMVTDNENVQRALGIA